MSIQISTIVCTYNRTAYLRRTLQGLIHQSLPPEVFEIIIVDNGSSDETRRLVLDEFQAVPNLQLVVASPAGLSLARNKGLQQARGEFVAYLDDDAVPCRRWLEAILAAFSAVTPPPGCVGGRIEPIWESDRPEWLHDHLIPLLTVLDYSDVPVVLGLRQYLCGANMAFRRDLLQQIGGFPLSLGRKGETLLGNEDVYVQKKVRGLGYTCYYHPDAAVHHYVHPNRVTKRWFRRRLYYHGVSKAIEHVTLTSPTRRQRLLQATVELVALLFSPRKLSQLLIPTNDPDQFRSRCWTLGRIGHLIGLLTSRWYRDSTA